MLIYYAKGRFAQLLISSPCSNPEAKEIQVNLLMNLSRFSFCTFYRVYKLYRDIITGVNVLIISISVISAMTRASTSWLRLFHEKLGQLAQLVVDSMLIELPSLIMSLIPASFWVTEDYVGRQLQSPFSSLLFGIPFD